MIDKNEKLIDEFEESSDIPGIIIGNVENAEVLYHEEKYATPRGHGFAAEDANHLIDKVNNLDFFGENKVELVGEDLDPETGHIIKNGADRIVNGQNIQTKYCSSGSKSIEECFENGQFRYINADGTPMQIEVPSDQYDAAVKAMENRINNGEVPGITDPVEAKNIVRKGNITYTQAKNIAKAGTIESITFDAANGCIVATGAMGISAIVSLATSIWNGESYDIALKKAVFTSIKVGGTTFLTAVFASQLSKAGLNSLLVGSSEQLVGFLGPKASSLIANSFRTGKSIYGAAAMKNAAKILRVNIITGVVSIVVLSAFDVADIFRGRISGKQLCKNVVNTTVSVGAGTVGYTAGTIAAAKAGAILGTACGGPIGTIIGGAAGALLAGSVASKATKKILDNFIEDDAENMVQIIEKRFSELAVDYLINKKEAENIADMLRNEITGNKLKDMYASSNKKRYADSLLVKHFENIAKRRKKIKYPDEKEICAATIEVLELISDENNKCDEKELCEE